MAQRGLKTIIALSFVLAIAFLLTILSAVLYKNFLTLVVTAIYLLAPLPNLICGKCANPDDFMESGSSAIIDLGRFLTGWMVMAGIALPILFAHCALIKTLAAVLSVCGGLGIFGAVKTIFVWDIITGVGGAVTGFAGFEKRL